MNVRELPKFFTVAEVATILACSSKQVGRLIKAGRLRAIDIGTGRTKELRISADGIQALGSPTTSPSSVSVGAARRRGPRMVPVAFPDPFPDASRAGMPRNRSRA